MHAWEAILDSLNYMEDHLSESMEMETLAGVASLSPYYYQRLFRRLVKKPVNEYLKLRRLAKASEALRNTKCRIVDVALDHGFSDHANFTREFRSAYGITPEEYRANPVTLNQYIKPDLQLGYAAVDEGVPFLADGIVVEAGRIRLDEPRVFIGVEGDVPLTELSGGTDTGISTIGLLWDDLHRRKPAMPHLLPGGNEIDVLYMGNAGKGCCNCFAGAETDGSAGAEGYASFTVPRGDYAVCRVEAQNFEELVGSAVFKANQFMDSWMKRHGLTCGAFAAELYFEPAPDAACMELWMPIGTSVKTSDMMERWDRTDGTRIPSVDTIRAYVDNLLFDDLCRHIEAEYQIKPVLAFSRCSMQFGWNVKYKKSGRALCTLYPMEGSFIALLVIGERERMETEQILPSFTEYVQDLYRETRPGLGQKWLMIHVADEQVLGDVKRCIVIRRGGRR